MRCYSLVHRRNTTRSRIPKPQTRMRRAVSWSSATTIERTSIRNLTAVRACPLSPRMRTASAERVAGDHPPNCHEREVSRATNALQGHPPLKHLLENLRNQCLVPSVKNLCLTA